MGIIEAEYETRLCSLELFTRNYRHAGRGEGLGMLPLALLFTG